jgi:hypothetical protein
MEEKIMSVTIGDDFSLILLFVGISPSLDEELDDLIHHISHLHKDNIQKVLSQD